MSKISIIVPSCGRPTLEYTVCSILRELRPSFGDELIVVGPRRPEVIKPRYDIRDDFTWVEYDNGGCDPVTLLSLNKEPGYPSGARERDLGRSRATGQYLMVIDDDDIFVPGALDLAHGAIALARDPLALHIFRMQYGCQKQWMSPFMKELPEKVWRGDDAEPMKVLWGEPILELGNIGGSMTVYPNNEHLGKWHTGKNENDDWWIVQNYVQAVKRRPVFHPEVNSIVKPTPRQLEMYLGIPRPTVRYAPQPAVLWDGRP